jgi:hypothetical protein
MFHVDSSRLFTLIDDDKADIVLTLLQDALQELGQFKTVYLHYKARVSAHANIICIAKRLESLSVY